MASFIFDGRADVIIRRRIRRRGDTLKWLAEQSRRYIPSRKVRTSQGEVVGNADPGKPAGKCHRNNTAHVRGGLGPSRAGKVEMVR
jgi:hypothetical protein